ncbi:MAG TPA: transcription antitermination factor NusB [Oculatellaceae cyanobacterium]
MSARRVARELAVIVMPQLPKNRAKLEALELDELVARAVHMLRDYAKEKLAETNAIILKSNAKLAEIEAEHPDNIQNVDKLASVPLKSQDLREQLDNLERALNLVSEALDIPEMALSSGLVEMNVRCKKCHETSTSYIETPTKTDVQAFLVSLIETYVAHRTEVDQFIKEAKAKWQVDRMVSIDRDILRLACTEALYMPDIPVSVCISEAVELCHRFADERAAKFVNGILGDLSEQAKYFRIHGRFRPDEATGTVEPSLT